MLLRLTVSITHSGRDRSRPRTRARPRSPANVMGPDLTVDKLLQDRATVPQRRVVECAVDDYGYSPPLGAIFASAGLSAMYRVLHLEPRRAPPGQVAARRPLDTIPSRPIPQA